MVDVTQRFDVVASLEVKTSDGNPFFSADLKYFDFPYDALLYVEKEGIKLVNDLIEVADASLADKNKT